MQPAMDHAALQQRTTARFSLAWMLAANAVGLWLAALLLWPEIGKLAGSVSYGRWMPLHMDWHLYGWCAMPMLGLVARLYWIHNGKAVPRTRFALGLWSVALLVGGCSWALGDATGKPFLNWNGFARFFFAASLACLWALAARGWWETRALRHQSPLAFYAKGLFALALAGVPVVLFLVSDARVYPPIDPTSGGATGHSLLASTLDIVAIMGVLPALALQLPRRAGASLRPPIAFWGLFAANVVLYLAIEHGDASNHSLNQIVGLGSLVVWPPMTYWLWRDYHWSQSSQLWRASFLFWWALLALTGWLTFLPQALDALRFTNGLVAHAHLAMAGMLTALNMVALLELGRDAGTRDALSRPWPFYAWNSALLAFVASMMVQGFHEGANPGGLFLFDRHSQVAYALRFLAGTAMALCSVFWLARALSRGGAARPNLATATLRCL